MDRERQLLRHGFALCLLALFTGLIAYGLANPRMGVLRLSPLAGVAAPILCSVLVLQGLRQKPAEQQG